MTSMMTPVELEARHTATIFKDTAAMMRQCPALFATTAHPRMSDRYAFTNTYDILVHMHNRGFRIESIMGGHKRYNKVMIRLRHKDHYELRGEAPELVLLDSHDGSSRLKMCMGVIKFLCMNGMIAGDLTYAKSFLHLTDDLIAQVLLEIEDIDTHARELMKRVDRMKNFSTNVGHRIAMADVAVHARFTGERSGTFVADMRSKLLTPRRIEDEENDMYTVMNVIQENALRGGISYISGNAVRRMSDIQAVDRNVLINTSLWNKAEELMAA